MSLPPIAQTDFDAQLAELERVADAPAEPLGYGRDLSCVTDCDDRFSETPPNSALIVAQAVTRRFITPRGSLLDDADYGLDIRSYLNRATPVQELRRIEAAARLEAVKDERVSDVELTLTLSADFKTLTLNALLVPVDTAVAPFAFVVSVTDAQVLLDIQGA